MSEFFVEALRITGEEGIRRNVPLCEYTTFHIGGNADYFAEPKEPQEIFRLIKLCDKYQIPYFVLGNGSNVLASDKGYRGLIIHILSKMNKIEVKENHIYAQAGASLIKTARVAADHFLTGMEFASGIPGSVGGAVYMNAGAYGGEMKQIVSFVRVMDKNGKIYDISCEKMDFSYRHSIVEKDGLIILGADFVLQPGNEQEIDDKMKSFAEARRSKQPLEYPSAGSTFKRPEGYFAGKLIMDAGLRGYQYGKAQVSEKHCGFVINRGGATAGEVIGLIRHVQSQVWEQFGVTLEMEVKTLGEFE